MDGHEGPTRKVGVFSLFWTFFQVSALTIGGGYAMIPVFAAKITKKGWLDEKSFYDLFAVGQSFPGPMAMNTAVLVGQRLAGPLGAAASFFGIVLPPFFAIVLASLAFERIGGHPLVRGFLKGAYGIVLGLVAAMLFRMLKNNDWKPWRLVLAGAGAVALVLLKGWAMPVFLSVVLVAFLGGRAPWK